LPLLGYHTTCASLLAEPALCERLEALLAALGAAVAADRSDAGS
jgi:hypothetical protein